jgi:hypothetical protein
MDKCMFRHTRFLCCFSAPFWGKQLLKVTDMLYLKSSLQHELAAAKLPNLSHPEFQQESDEGLAGNIRNEMTQKRARPSSTDAEAV